MGCHERFDGTQGLRADELVHHFAIFEEFDGRDTADGIRTRDIRLLVGIKFHHLDTGCRGSELV